VGQRGAIVGRSRGAAGVRYSIGMELMNIGSERYINARHIVSVRIGWRGTIVTMVNGERFRVEEKARDFAILLCVMARQRRTMGTGMYKQIAIEKRKETIADLIEDARRFRFCGPSDDPDEQTAVTAGYRHLVTQFKRLASPVLASPSATRLNAIEVEVDNLYSAYDAKSELDALLPEIEAALEHLDDLDLHVADGLTIVADSRLVELRSLVSTDFDFRKLELRIHELPLDNSVVAFGEDHGK
jgi:hypothetical protein